jgi:hypothetical protein
MGLPKPEDLHDMAKLDRVLQKIFGSSGGGSEFGQIGSLAAGSPTYSKDLDTIQALTQFLEGLFALTNSGAQPPRIQDINSLYYLFSSQLKYLFQAGIPEWIATEEYYIGSICQVAGVLYTSFAGTSGSPNVGNAVTDGTNWKKTLDIGEISGMGTNWPVALIATLASNVAHVMHAGLGTNWQAALEAAIQSNIAHVLTTGLGADWQGLLEAAANTAVKNNDSDKVDGQHAAAFATSTQGAKADAALPVNGSGSYSTGTILSVSTQAVPAGNSVMVHAHAGAVSTGYLSIQFYDGATWQHIAFAAPVIANELLAVFAVCIKSTGSNYRILNNISPSVATSYTMLVW